MKDFPRDGVINDGLDSHPNTPRGLGFVVPDGLQYPDDHVTIDGLYWQVTNDGIYVGRQCIFPLLTVLCAFPRIPVGGQIIVGRLPERQLAPSPYLPGFAVATLRAFNLPVRIVFPAQLLPQNVPDYVAQLRIVVNGQINNNSGCLASYGWLRTIAIAILADIASGYWRAPAARPTSRAPGS